MSLKALRIVWRITALNFRAQLEYRTEFLLMIAIGAIWQVSVIVFATVLLSRFTGMGGWDSSDVLLIPATRMLAHGLFVLFLGRMHWAGRQVQEGRIDIYLMRPMPVHRQIQLAFFPTNAIGDLTVAAGLMVGALARSDMDWTTGRVTYLIAAVLGGMLLEAALFTVVASASLRFPAADMWGRWLEELLGTFGSYPLNVLPRAVGGLLTFGLPLAFVAYFPAAVLTGHGHGTGVPYWLAAASPLLGLLAYLGARLVWRWSLRHYSGING
ncbi:ABC transporter permease GacY [Streptomyces viridochromogenes DSM 40736]|uniref:ABC transporter permease GacY n=1 Tax=Streptomyces viridochromogenes (strain DSM 40736 / JCM 4977 / BCRC 1201 / Tue 494) TaxID=591159 RepID=D9X2S9_STRVT|nr:ABC-2 family transporter protein [Streptomyces viridochromogenes]EFL35766.1 ABC transporter permease GacY [Streptomyces viridochromogenes DSM 40736]